MDGQTSYGLTSIHFVSVTVNYDHQLEKFRVKYLTYSVSVREILLFRINRKIYSEIKIVFFRLHEVSY